MCPLYPLHLVFLYLCLLLPLLLALVEGMEELGGSFKLLAGKNLRLKESESAEIKAICTSCPSSMDRLILSSNAKSVASISWVDGSTIYHQKRLLNKEESQEVVVNLRETGNWSVIFNVTAHFLGFADIKADASSQGQVLKSDQATITVLRNPTLASKLFTSSVATLISLAYISMGCAMDLSVVKANIRRPFAPIIGFLTQFVAMPLISFALGFLFESPAMRLGLFVTGTSPGGGASNIWTLMLGGSLDLSLTMTTISTFSAFFMMPVWIFTLGRVIFNDSAIIIPYSKIMLYASCLIIPLLIGVALTRYAPKVSKFLVRILKPMALGLLLFIIIFGIYANQYIFAIMDYKVWSVGMALPWIGFVIGWIAASLSGREMQDKIAIAIETGIQNTGVSIFILWFTLDRPLGDLAAVIPVATAMMTPFPLFMALIAIKVKSFFCPKSSEYTSGSKEDGSFNMINRNMAEKPVSMISNSIIKPPNENIDV